LVSIAGVSISAAFLRPRNAVDDSLNRCLIQATVRIAPQGDPIRGCGVIVDQLNGLVVTVADVMGERENASVFFPCLMNGDNVEKGRERAESESAAKVVYRDRVRRLVVLRIEHCPDGTASLPLGTWQCSPGQSLHSVYSHAKDAETTATSWSFSRGHIQQTLMVPHL